MKTKIVYVVTSDKTDVYLEQTLLSVFSLRKHNPDAYVELVVDQDTNLTIAGKRVEILKYVNNKIVVKVPDQYNKAQKSRWLKTSLRKHVQGDYLFIDTDTLITDCLDDIDLFKGEIGAVADHHEPIKRRFSRIEKLQKWSKEDSWRYCDGLLYFNSGVIFVRDCPFSILFYEEWHKIWKLSLENYGRIFDQSPLAATNEKFNYPIKELDGIWNCQLNDNGLLYLVNAKVMHYDNYGADHYFWKMYDKQILNSIKSSGCITEEAKELVIKAKSSFVIPYKVITGDELDLYESKLFKLCFNSPTMFRLLSRTSDFIIALHKYKLIAHKFFKVLVSWG